MHLQYALAGVVSLAMAGGCGGGPASVEQASQGGEQRAADVPAAIDAPANDGATGKVVSTEESEDPLEPGSSIAEDLSRDYEQLRLMTDKPVPIASEIFTLCSSEAIEQGAIAAQKRSGPHALTAIRVFMNDSAAAAFRRSAEAYPPGAAIVKEKQFHATDGGEMPLAVAGMIKREAGYDLRHGDWEYFYRDEKSQFERGKIASCIECHRNAAQMDYVFGDWAEQGGAAAVTSAPP